MGARFDNIQVLRFVAATGVVVAHAVDLAGTRLGLDTVLAGGTLEDFGAAGVDLFFVISGFIIAVTTKGQAGIAAAGDFLWRRFRRVAPIYWLLSLPILVGMIRGGTLTGEVAVATFLFWPFSGLEMTFPALGPGWTLCFEMLFYAGFGLAMAGGGRTGWVLAGAVLAAVVAGLFVATPGLRFVGSSTRRRTIRPGPWSCGRRPRGRRAAGSIWTCRSRADRGWRGRRRNGRWIRRRSRV